MDLNYNVIENKRSVLAPLFEESKWKLIKRDATQVRDYL